MTTQNESINANMENSRSDPKNSSTTQDQSPQAGDPATSGENGMNMDSDNDSDAKPNAPMQKRRRVTRACDECRRKKIKCDGKQPCTHCTVYSYGMCYDRIFAISADSS